jgi:hypothetical protein
MSRAALSSQFGRGLRVVVESRVSATIISFSTSAVRDFLRSPPSKLMLFYDQFRLTGLLSAQRFLHNVTLLVGRERLWPIDEGNDNNSTSS